MVLKHRHFVNRVFESAEHDRETVEEVSNGFNRKTGEIMQFTAREWPRCEVLARFFP